MITLNDVFTQAQIESMTTEFNDQLRIVDKVVVFATDEQRADKIKRLKKDIIKKYISR